MISVETSGKFASFDLSKMSEVMKACSLFMYDEVMENFAQQGRPIKWEMVKEATRKRKKRPEILIETGRLLRSLTSGSSEDEAWVDGGDASAPYGKYNHFVRKNAPARPFLMLPDDRYNELVNVFAKEFEDRVITIENPKPEKKKGTGQ